MLSIIVAKAKNNIIGKDNNMALARRFKKI